MCHVTFAGRVLLIDWISDWMLDDYVVLPFRVSSLGALCVAVGCSGLQWVGVCCSVLQLQRVALRHAAIPCLLFRYRFLQCVAVRCSAL